MPTTTDLDPLFGTTMTAPVISMPVAPVNTDGTPISELQTMILKEEIKQYVTQTKDFKANLAALHSVAWGQCSEALKSKIKTLNGFQAHADTHDIAFRLCWQPASVPTYLHECFLGIDTIMQKAIAGTFLLH